MQGPITGVSRETSVGFTPSLGGYDVELRQSCFFAVVLAVANLALGQACTECPSGVYRVDEEADTAPHDGSSWDHAYYSLRDLLEAQVLNSGDCVFIAPGDYDPGAAESPDENDTFALPSGVKFFGGFATDGTEECPNQRNLSNWKNWTTVLTGQLAGGLIAYHVVTIPSDSTSTVLDGLTIKAGGVGEFEAPVANGAGILANGGDLSVSNSSPVCSNWRG